jgi:hypothetical protein
MISAARAEEDSLFSIFRRAARTVRFFFIAMERALLYFL